MKKMIVSLLLIITNIACEMSARVNGLHKVNAEKEARSYSEELGILDVIGLSCSNNDTDGDGYVSCSINSKTMGLISAECVGAYNFGSGCRPMKSVINK